MGAVSSSGALSTYKRPRGEIDKTNAMVAASLPAGVRRKGLLGKYFGVYENWAIRAVETRGPVAEVFWDR